VNYEPPFLLSGVHNSRAFAEIAVVRDRGNANAHYQYGVALLHENKPYLALGELEEAIEINPSHVEAKRAAVRAMSAVASSLTEDRKRLIEYMDDEYCHPVLNDAPPSGAADIHRPRMGEPETIEDFAQRKGLTVAQLEEAAHNWRAANSETPTRENMALAVAEIYWNPLRYIAKYTRWFIHNLRGATDMLRRFLIFALAGFALVLSSGAFGQG